MMKGVLLSLFVFACPLIWLLLIVPLLANCFGAPYKIGALPFDRRNEALSRWHRFWFAGVLGWGVAVFSVLALLQYFGDLSPVTPHRLLLELLSYAVVGGLLSQWNFPSRKI